jgi:hypothetical protein
LNLVAINLGFLKANPMEAPLALLEIVQYKRRMTVSFKKPDQMTSPVGVFREPTTASVFHRRPRKSPNKKHKNDVKDDGEESNLFLHF